MRRFLATASVSACALFASAGVLAGTSRPTPVVGRAVRTAVSQRVSALPSASSTAGKGEPREEREVENNQIPRSLGPFHPGNSHDEALPSVQPAPNMPGPSLTFNGLSADDYAAQFGGSRVEPPDTNGDVGPNHYVQIVNSLFRVYDKTGSPLTPIAKLSDLFAPLGGICGTLATGNDGDPIALYDPMADRWLLSEFALPAFPSPPYHQCIAISQTGDPTGSFFLYDFIMPDKINDYPHFGVWPDGYYMSDNQFDSSLSYAGAGLFAFDRLKMLAGDPSATFIYFDFFATDPTAGGMLPTDLDGLVPPPPGTPNFFMEFRADEFGDPIDALRIYEFHADFVTPANSTLTVRPDLAVAAFDARQPAGRTDIEEPPPATSSQYLDSLSDRMMHRIAFRILPGGVQSFVVNWTVNVSGVDPSSSASAYQAAVRFEELRRDSGTGVFSIQNQVTYSTDPGNGATGRNLWMGSAAQDNQGNSAVGFSGSSTTLLPSIIWAGRLASDPANTLGQGEATMQAGAGVQQDAAARWGDYSNMSIDPADDCTFWYTQEYYANNGNFDWKTKVGKFAYAGCTPAPKGTLQGQVTDCVSGDPIAGVVVSTVEGFFATTDASGNYSMTMPPGSYTVSFSKTGYTAAAAGAAITDGNTTIVNICLTGFPILGSAGATLVAEACTPPNGVLDPGETVTVSFCVQNTGALDTTDLVATLQATGGVTNPSSPQDYGVVTAGGPPVCRNFTFVVGTLCGETTRATLQLQDGTTDFGKVEYDFQNGVLTQTFAENFDGVTAPNLPPGWVASNAAGSAPLWVTSTTTPDTAPNDAFVDDPATVSDKRLDSPPIAINSPAAQVSFRNNYNLETQDASTGYDGGVLEISIGGGAFQDILAAGGAFTAGGYDHVISSSFGNPLAARPAWSGNSGGYITTTLTLPASANGQNVTLRWRMGSDNSFGVVGWRIDTITINGGYVCCSLPVPFALAVDAHASGGSSNVNGVFEPGEQVVVEPTWMNGGSSATFSLTGIASNYTGPGGATYTLNDSSAAYGSLTPLSAGDCFPATGDCYQMSVDNPAVRPVQHWDATFQETPNVALPSGFPVPVKTWTLHIGGSFADTPTSNIFYSFIENIFHNGVTAGCNATDYCPGNSTLRKQMAVFVLKSRFGSSYVPPGCTGVFADVPCPGPFTDWIEDLFNRGVVAGCGGGNYCPDNPVLRQQMAVFLLKTLLGGSYVPPACTGIFNDVACPSTFADWIEDLFNRSIAAGCGGGNYCPTNPTTRGQMAPFLARTFSLLLYGP